MALNYTDQEKKLLKKFLVFLLFIILFINVLLIYNSSKYRISQIVIENIAYQNLTNDFLLNSFGHSIWTISESTFVSIIDKYDELEGIEVRKNYPNQLSIQLIETRKMAVILDFRKSTPETLLLLKNASLIPYSDQVTKDLTSVTITNGPVPESFYGEIVSFIATLDNDYSFYIKSELTFSGNNLVGNLQGTVVDFGYPIDLGKKASAIKYFLQNNSCQGEVRFIGSEEFIADCNI